MPAGMLIAYFPREKIVVQADLFNAAATAANANTARSTRTSSA